MTTQPDERLARELRELLAKATELPWRLSEKGSSIRRTRMIHRRDGSEAGEVDSRIIFGHDGDDAARAADYALIVAAVNALPTLLDALEQERRINNDLGENECRWRDLACEAEAKLQSQSPALAEREAVVKWMHNPNGARKYFRPMICEAMAEHIESADHLPQRGEAEDDG